MALELTTTGLSTQTQQEIADELAAKIRATFGENTKTSADSIMGQLVNIVAELRAVDQQTLLAVYRSFDPNGAIGSALDRLLTLTGSTRLGALSSVVDGLAEFSAAGSLNDGDLIRNSDNDTLWKLINGPVVAGGAGFFAATFQAVDTGPTLANAATSWSVVTVVANFVGFTNPADDAELGRNQESDADARARRIVELFSQGTGPLATIRAAVSRVDGVIGVNAYHNPSVNPADVDGIPFKAFNVVAQTQPTVPTAALQQLIFDAIFSAMGAGGQAYGTGFSGTSIDTEGIAHVIAFDTVDVQDIEIEIDLVTSTSESPITPNIEAVVAAQVILVAQAGFEEVGRDVLALDFRGIVYDMLQSGTISGVDDVTVRLSIQPAPPAAVAKLSIGIRQIADYDSGNLTVVQV